MIGNILALTNSTSNENIEVDGLLKKGLYNGNASDLKSEIDKKSITRGWKRFVF